MHRSHGGLVLILILGLIGCEHQYIAIPGGEVISGTFQYAYEDLYADEATPSHAVVEGSPDLVVGESVVYHFEFSSVTSFEVTELVFLGLETGDTELGSHWRYELDDEEREAGEADVEFFALDEKPDDEWCARDYRGVGTCYQEADEGLTDLGVVAAGDNATSMIDMVPLSLDPMQSSEDDACASFTVEDCCTGGDGISVVACYVSPPCGCPSGTSDGGTQGDGTTMCYCPS